MNKFCIGDKVVCLGNHHYDALAQSKHDAGPDEMPVVMHRRNDSAWVVIQPLEDWIKLYDAESIDK